MERSNEYQDLATALAELRPTPTADFSAELDQRVAAGFPRRPRFAGARLAACGDRLRGIRPQRVLFAGGGAVLAAIAIATVIVAGGDSRQPAITLDRHSIEKIERGSGAQSFSGIERFSGPAEQQLRSAPASASSTRDAHGTSEGLNAGFARLGRGRDIERSAEIGLLAEPVDVAGDAAAVFAAVHDAHGIVLHSTTTSGKRAGARFELLIPSARLGDALAAFSAIDEVRARHEATDDITAPTVAASERLRDSRARVDGFLARLSAAETEAEMEAIEGELTRERRHAAGLRARLERLEQRTDFSRVAVTITSGDAAGSGGAWGIGDALDDAGHILGIAAGVTLVGLAVLAPIALLALLAWLAHRTWVRTQRKRALGDA